MPTSDSPDLSSHSDETQLPISPIPPNPTKSKLPKFIYTKYGQVVVMAILMFLVFLIAALIVVQSDKYKQGAQPQPSASLTPTPVASVDTSDWETYRNEEYGFELKYPKELVEDFENRGFISGSDYYGTRDFNFILYDSRIEPSHEGFSSDKTGESTWQYDGYNFAIFSGMAETNHLKNKQDLIDSGLSSSPPLQSSVVDIDGKNHTLYYQPPSNNPQNYQTAFWFMSFPLNEGVTMIVTGNYDRQMLTQILSTFRFLDTSDLQEIPIMSEFGGKVVYGTALSTEEKILAEKDCSQRAGKFRTCGNICEPESKTCVTVCAFTCEY